MLKKASMFAIGLLLLPSAAAACSGCALSLFEYLLPHAHCWSLGMLIWFCAVMMLTSGRKELLSVLIAVFLAFLTGVAMFGPWSFMLLGFIAFCFTLQSCRPKVRQKMSKGKQTAFKIVSVTAFVGISAGLLISAQIKSTRSDAEFILQWRNTHISMVVLQRLLVEPERNEAQLRKIIAEMKNDTMDECFIEKITHALAEMKEKEKGNFYHDNAQ